MIPLSWYLTFSAALLCIGLFGVLARKNAVGILIGVELMLNAVNINLLAFWSYLYSSSLSGLVFVAVVFVSAAAEVAVGMALIISAYRRRNTVTVNDMDLLNG
jgi:NADH:ubiquinone oxidoreductase subunit K